MNPSYVALRRRLLLEGQVLDYFPANSDVLVPQVGSGVALTFSRASTATRWNHAGQLVTVAQNVPRIDYDPVTGRNKGLLIEESRTNLVAQSIPSALWWKHESVVDIEPNAAIAPDGTMTATRVNVTAWIGPQSNFSPVVEVGQPYTFSIWVKSATGAAQPGLLWIEDNAPGFTTAQVAFTATTEWQRVSVTAVVPEGTVNFRCSVRIGHFYLWGAQLERGTFPTSFIKTEGTPATRAADVCTIDDISGFFNATEGTILVEGSVLGSKGASQVIANISDGTNNERITLFRDSSGNWHAEIVAGGVFQATVVPSALAVGSVSKFAFAYKENDYAGCVDGGAVVTDTTGTLPTVDRMDIGAMLSSLHWNGHIRRIRYWPRRLPNDQLRTLTA